MAKQTQARDASEFGKFVPRKADEFLDQKVIITDFLRMKYDEKPYYQVQIVVENTGETVRFNAGNKYIMQFFDAVGDATQCPIQAIFFKPGEKSKAIAVRGWNEPEVSFDE